MDAIMDASFAVFLDRYWSSLRYPSNNTATASSTLVINYLACDTTAVSSSRPH